MKSSDAAADKEALATLRGLREHLDLTELSDQDREALAKSWASIYDPTPTKTFSLGGPMMAMALPIFDPNSLDIDPRLIPVTLALRTFAHAIELGLPGAEHEAEGFLRDCGFEEDTAQEILRQMLAQAPEPEPGDLN